MSNLRKFFDYNSLPDNATRATLRQEAQAIKLAVKRTHDNIIEIGNRLIHAKEVAGHGNFMEWCDAEFGLTYDKANDFMNVARAFSKLENSPTLLLSQSALFALAAPSISDETRAVIVEEVQAGTVKTIADVKEWVDAAKPIIPSNSTELEDDDDLGPDPFADEDAGDSMADIAEIEAKDDAPVADPTDQLESQYFDDEEAPAPPAHIPTVEETVDALPLAQALSLYGHGGQLFRQQARLIFSCSPAIKAAHSRLSEIRHMTGPVSDALRAVAKLPDPSQWEGCAACKGSTRVGERHDPCQQCRGGFTIHKGEGVSADVVSAFAQSL